MKKLLFLLLIVLSSCGSKVTQQNKETVIPLPVEPEIIYVEDTARIAELEKELFIVKDSLKFYRDSIPYDTYINARRIEKIKYYIRITENKPSNQKFFYGWIRRTMNEN